MRRFILLGFALTLLGATNGRPPIVEAAHNSDKAALRALVQKKADVNATEGDGTTALHWASYRDDLESADLLIRAGAKANAANDLGVTPLWNAAQNGSAGMVRRLLEAGANPNAALLAGETPLMVAARSGFAGVVEQLASKGANLNARGSRGQTALMWAVAQKHPDVVRVLLAYKADVHARSETWSQVMAVPPHGLLEFNRNIPHGNDTALLFAARVGDLESAKLLVAAGANVNDKEASGVSAMTLAAHSDYRELAEFLLDKGADANAAEGGFAALHSAAMHRDAKLVSSLLAHGADANARVKLWTPTRRSSDDYHFPPAMVGATPYWLAARVGAPEVMRLLAKKGADTRVVHHSEYVTEARMQRRSEETNALLAALGMGGGVLWSPIPPNEREATVLETVKLAVELGADVNAVNEGRTALDAAKTLKYNNVVAFLTEKGAKPSSNSAKQ